MSSDPTTTRKVEVDGHVFKYFVHVVTNKIHLTDIPEDVLEMPTEDRMKLLRAAVAAAEAAQSRAGQAGGASAAELMPATVTLRPGHRKWSLGNKIL